MTDQKTEIKTPKPAETAAPAVAPPSAYDPHFFNAKPGASALAPGGTIKYDPNALDDF